MCYHNILVLHSFHYPGRKRDGTLYYEEYARKVGKQLGKIDLPDTIVMESPKKRHLKHLMERHNARWILDLHNDVYPYDPEIKHLLATLYFQSNLKKTAIDKTRQWIRNNYTNRQGVYPISIVNTFSRRPKNFIGVELYSHNHLARSVEFVKKFIDFLNTT